MLIQDSLYVPGIQSFPKLRTAAVKLQGRAESIHATGGGNTMGKLLKAFWDDQKARIGSANGTWHDGLYLGQGNEDIRPLCYAVQSHIRLYPNAKDKADFTAFCDDMAARGDAIGAPPVVHVTGVSWKAGLPTTGEVGAVLDLQTVITPANATDLSRTYTVDDETVATVASPGDHTAKLTLKAAGTIKVTVKTTDGGFTAVHTVTVTAPAAKNEA